MKRVAYLGLLLALLGWVGLMVSFWLPGAAGSALQATALSLGIPGLIVAAGTVIFAEELAEYDPFPKRPPRPMRCTDCGSKILNVAGTTVGDQIEGELMAGPWAPHERKNR